MPRYTTDENGEPVMEVEVVNPDALTEDDLRVEQTDGVLCFDASAPIPFYVRFDTEEGNVGYHDLPGILTQPKAERAAREAGFNIVGVQVFSGNP